MKFKIGKMDFKFELNEIVFLKKPDSFSGDILMPVKIIQRRKFILTDETILSYEIRYLPSMEIGCVFQEELFGYRMIPQNEMGNLFPNNKHFCYFSGKWLECEYLGNNEIKYTYLNPEYTRTVPLENLMIMFNDTLHGLPNASEFFQLSKFIYLFNLI